MEHNLLNLEFKEILKILQNGKDLKCSLIVGEMIAVVLSSIYDSYIGIFKYEDENECTVFLIEPDKIIKK